MDIKSKVKQGVPKARIAAELGISRQSVYNVLNKDSTRERKARSSKLDGYRQYIKTRLELVDLPATVLLRELQQQGYTGGISILKEYASSIRARHVSRLTERFETLPGFQAQVDWGECGTITDETGSRRRLYVFVFVLGYSRMLYAHFTTSTRQHVLLSLLKAAFEEIGVPRELLIDNMRQAVTRHEVAGERRVVFNPVFLDFCEHYGVKPLAAPPYWPRVKGKVEAGVKYIKNSFLNGREFVTLNDLNAQLRVWLDGTANLRLHGTTGERPIDRYQQEAKALRRAAGVPVDTRELLIRKVAMDAHFRLWNVAYSVPPGLAGESVMIRTSSQQPGSVIEISVHGQVVARHEIPVAGVRRVTDPAHAEELRRVIKARATAARPKRQTYQQVPVGSELLLPGRTAAPVVQTRSISEYEALA